MGLLEIGDSAFSLCDELERVNIPPTVKIIGDCAFLCCPKLVKVNFQGEALEKIKYGAFRGCSKLAQVDLPNTVKEIKLGLLRVENYPRDLTNLT